MEHVFILEPFIRPVDEIGRIGIKVYLQQSQCLALFRFLAFSIAHETNYLNEFIPG